jgi:sugar/nucleoside kinase (ribokinase family)
MNQRVLIVGSIALDDVKTPFGEEKEVLGGAAIYGSIAASTCAPVDVVGVAGEDFPDIHLQRLQRRGVDTSGIEIVPGGKTFRWGGEYVGEMDEAITHFTDLGVFGSFEPRVPDRFRDDPVVFLANIHPAIQLAVLDQVRSPRLVLCDTMNYWIQSERETLLKVLSRVDVALLNAGEARMLFNTNSLPQAGMELIKMGLKRAVIKKGEHGVLMFSESGFYAVPAMPLERVLDPTGAGDSFAGGFSGYVARSGNLDEQTLRQAVVVGSAAASFVVEDFSTRRLEELDARSLEERCHRLHHAMHVERIALND